jgi:iron(III) transport system permease protein
VSGKGGERRPFDVGGWRWVLLGYAALVGLLSVVLPLVILLLASVSKAWGRGMVPGNFTLGNFYAIFFEQLTVRSALLNTVLFMGALILLYGNTQYLTDLIAGRNIIVFVCTFVGINAVAELVVSTLVTAALCTALERARLMGGQR